jgi:hypothetical protein
MRPDRRQHLVELEARGERRRGFRLAFGAKKEPDRGDAIANYDAAGSFDSLEDWGRRAPVCRKLPTLLR